MLPRARTLISLAALGLATTLAVPACAPPARPALPPSAPAPARDRDTDCDGIADVDDQCPGAAEDRDGFQDDDGCPDPDNDQDGIPDECDQCPDEPETYNGIRDEDGCPDVGRVVITDREIIIIPQVFFAPGAIQIQPGSRPLVEEIALTLKDHPEIERIATLGHAAADEASAPRLSERRAEAVRAAIVALGVDPARIEAHGYGSTRPLVMGKSAAEKARNRRVEFAVLRASGRDLRTWNGQELADVPRADPPSIPRELPTTPVKPCVPRVAPPLPSVPCRAEPRKNSVPVGP
jgi:outer membrane protein OmpA-like peptidoglycan-associated protein